MEVDEVTANVAALLVDRHIAANHGSKLAFTFRDKRYSYHDLAALVNRTGNALRDLGVQPGGDVLLLIPPSPPFIAGLLGAMKIGAVPIVCAGTVHEAAIRRCTADSSPVAVLVHQDHLAAAQAVFGEGSDALVVVGRDTQGHTSFVDLVREAPSSLSGAKISPQGRVLAIYADDGMLSLDHRALADILSASGSASGALKDWIFIPVLRAFARGEEASLPILQPVE